MKLRLWVLLLCSFVLASFSARGRSCLHLERWRLSFFAQLR